jgi:hypothetical protein
VTVLCLDKEKHVRRFEGLLNLRVRQLGERASLRNVVHFIIRATINVKENILMSVTQRYIAKYLQRN